MQVYYCHMCYIIIGEFVIATAKQTILSMLSVRESLCLSTALRNYMALLVAASSFAMLCTHVVCDKNSMRRLDQHFFVTWKVALAWVSFTYRLNPWKEHYLHEARVVRNVCWEESPNSLFSIVPVDLRSSFGMLICFL